MGFIGPAEAVPLLQSPPCLGKDEFFRSLFSPGIKSEKKLTPLDRIQLLYILSI